MTLRRLCLVLLTAVLVPMTGTASAATVTEQTPQVYIPVCYVGIFVAECTQEEDWTARCPDGMEFGAWGKKPETFEVDIEFWQNTANFEVRYNDMNDFSGRIVPPISFTCVTVPTATAASTDSKQLSVHRLVITRKLRGRKTTMRLRCARGERRVASNTAIGIVRRTRVDPRKIGALIQSKHRRRTRSARMTVKVDKRLDKSHHVVAQLRIDCAPG